MYCFCFKKINFKFNVIVRFVITYNVQTYNKNNLSNRFIDLKFFFLFVLDIVIGFRVQVLNMHQLIYSIVG